MSDSDHSASSSHQSASHQSASNQGASNQGGSHGASHHGASHHGGESKSGGSERASRAYGTGRTCKEDGCQVRLSVYNPGSFCSLHEPMVVPRTRGRKIA